MRDDFPEAVKREVAHRAGGRCSYPGCDQQCWLPGSGPTGTTQVGVIAHIRAASPGGPRFEPTQTREDRKSSANAIYLCETHATLIDKDPQQFPPETLREFKERHEAQVAGVAAGNLLLPEIRIHTHTGITISTERPRVWEGREKGERIQRTLTIRNATDFRYESLGFTLQYPELVERWPSHERPPGTEVQCKGFLENVEVGGTGGGRVEVGSIEHERDLTFEIGSLDPGREIAITLVSIPDPIGQAFGSDIDDCHVFSICGEVRVRVSNIFQKQGFTAPIHYNIEDRMVAVGAPHDSALYRDRYITRKLLA